MSLTLCALVENRTLQRILFRPPSADVPAKQYMGISMGYVLLILSIFKPTNPDEPNARYYILVVRATN